MSQSVTFQSAGGVCIADSVPANSRAGPNASHTEPLVLGDGCPSAARGQSYTDVTGGSPNLGRRPGSGFAEWTSAPIVTAGSVERVSWESFCPGCRYCAAVHGGVGTLVAGRYLLS